MVLWLLAEGPALAGLTVEDAAGCLDREAVELEVRSLLGDEVADRLAFVVRLEQGTAEGADDGAGAGERRWTLRLAVSNHGSAVWDRQIRVEREDCPYLPTLAAQSFESGLSGVPGWSLPGPAKPPAEGGFQTFFTVPTDKGAFRMAFGPDLWFGVTRTIRWQATLDLQWSAVERYELAGAQAAGVTVATGPGIQVPLTREVALRWSHRVGIGIAATVGLARVEASEVEDFIPTFNLYPRFPYTSDLGLVLGESVRVFGRFEASMVNVAWYVDRPDGTVVGWYREPPVRLGFGFEVAGMLRKRDVVRPLRE